MGVWTRSADEGDEGFLRIQACPGERLGLQWPFEPSALQMCAPYTQPMPAQVEPTVAHPPGPASFAELMKAGRAPPDPPRRAYRAQAPDC